MTNSGPLLKFNEIGGIPYIPAQAPFSSEQRAWLNGYLAGMFSRALQDAPSSQTTAPESAPGKPLYILHGSQSGTAEGIAKDLSRQAREKGFDPVLLELNDYEKMDRSSPQTALIVTSTWGDGEAPDNAVEFWNHIQQSDVTGWDQIFYSILALGDSNYAEFCGAGKMFDQRLLELGAKRICDRVDCDVDYEASAEAWTRSVWDKLTNEQTNPIGQTSTATTREPSRTENHSEIYSRNNPFPASLITQRKLNHKNSAKDTRHVEISLEGSDLKYAAGDALGLLPSNDPALVEMLLDRCGMDPDALVRSKDTTEKPLKDALIQDCQISKINDRLLQSLTSMEGYPQKKTTPELVEGMDLLDVIPEEAKLNAQELVDLLPKLQPRLYSIASSPLTHPNAVHLTVGVVRYELNDRLRNGVCSTFLADRVTPSDKLPVFIHPSTFKLPEDHDRSVIMVGPGTGIAPFRGFLQERKAQGGSGKNWLFFGDQKASTDFLYQEELKTFQADGVLHRLQIAFSRDQANKIYVQDRMQEQARELWNWLEDGAYFYVCGDAKRMAKDVDATLLCIVAEQGTMSPEKAEAYLSNLKKEKRYLRDVY